MTVLEGFSGFSRKRNVTLFYKTKESFFISEWWREIIFLNVF